MAATRAYSVDEQNAMLQALATARDRLLYLAGLFTGYRIHELLTLRIADLWHAGTPLTELVVDRARLKGGSGVVKRRVKARVVPMNPVFRAAVQAFILEQYGDVEPPAYHFVFRSRKGENLPISNVQAWRIIKSAALSCIEDATRIATHSSRKTFARSIYDGSGHDIILTQKAMAHRSVMTTATYLESTQDEVRTAVMAITGPSLHLPTNRAPAPVARLAASA